jgi:hypothetical protein
VPKYSGKGDTNSADSFTCAVDTGDSNQVSASVYLQ